MRYIFIVSVLLVVLLTARDNPFKPIVSLPQAGKMVDKKETKESFTSVETKLPSSARVLKSVEFHFQNLDGSMQSKKVEVGKDINWHDGLIVKKLTNNISPRTTTAPTLPKKIESKTEEINFKDITRLIISDNSIHIKTEDKIIRDFLVTNPHKIVVDFEREISFFTEVHTLDLRYFKLITIGKHSGFYRIAIELDGKYLYTKQKTEDGYLIRLR